VEQEGADWNRTQRAAVGRSPARRPQSKRRG
jgi:hypothetical protein